jgi:hypothetical protein
MNLTGFMVIISLVSDYVLFWFERYFICRNRTFFSTQHVYGAYLDTYRDALTKVKMLRWNLMRIRSYRSLRCYDSTLPCPVPKLSHGRHASETETTPLPVVIVEIEAI